MKYKYENNTVFMGSATGESKGSLDPPVFRENQ